MVKLSSQKCNWETEASAECKNNTKWSTTNSFSGLKNLAPKTQNNNFTSSFCRKFPVIGLSRPCIRTMLLREAPMPGFHLLQMPISPQTTRQNTGGHLEGRNHLMGFCVQKHNFVMLLNRISQSKYHHHWALSDISLSSLDMDLVYFSKKLHSLNSASLLLCLILCIYLSHSWAKIQTNCVCYLVFHSDKRMSDAGRVFSVWGLFTPFNTNAVFSLVKEVLSLNKAYY